MEKKRDIVVTLLLGATGAGKTKTAVDFCMDNKKHYYFCSNIDGASGIWFDGYHGQEVIIIDNFTGWIPIKQLLQLLDEKTWYIPTSCGIIAPNYKYVFITSRYSWDKWYSTDDTLLNEDIGLSIENKIHRIVQLEGVYPKIQKIQLK